MSYLPDPARYEAMKYQRCGRSGVLLPRISLGLWQNFGDDDRFKTGRHIVRRAFDLGITHFVLSDTPYLREIERQGNRLLPLLRD